MADEWDAVIGKYGTEVARGAGKHASVSVRLQRQVQSGLDVAVKVTRPGLPPTESIHRLPWRKVRDLASNDTALSDQLLLWLRKSKTDPEDFGGGDSTHGA